MDLLRVKLKSTTLMETVVATVIILAVFFVSSLILNNMAQKLLANKTFGVENRMEKLYYLYDQKQLELPYEETFQSYTIYVNKDLRDGVLYLHFEGVQQNSDNLIIRSYVEN